MEPDPEVERNVDELSSAGDVASAVAAALIVAVAPAEELGDASEGVGELVDRAAVGARVSPIGYVRCDVAPFDTIVNVGRITSWPSGAYAHAQNVTCRCYMLPTSIITRRRVAFVVARCVCAW